MERRLAAILAADVVGYSRLMAADEAATLATLTRHREAIGELIGQRGGRLVGTAGDSVLAEFPSVIEAVQCAVEIQQAMGAANADLPGDRRMLFRIGVNMGDIIAKDGDVFGDGVNVAARLQALATPGGICISRAVRDQLRDKAPFVFEDWASAPSRTSPGRCASSRSASAARRARRRRPRPRSPRRTPAAARPKAAGVQPPKAVATQPKAAGTQPLRAATRRRSSWRSGTP
jgi:class 3 adenylate cyclase